MPQIEVRIPYDGSFPTNTTGNQFDFCQLTRNRFAACYQQVTQSIGFVGTWDFADYVDPLNLVVSARTHEAFFYDTPTKQTVHRINDTHWGLVRDEELHVFSVTDDTNGFVTKEYENLTEFERGHSTWTTAFGNGHSRNFIFKPRCVEDNVWIVAESKVATGVTGSTGPGEHHIFRMDFSPVSGYSNVKTPIVDFSTGPLAVEALEWGVGFDYNLENVPNSDKKLLSFYTVSAGDPGTQTKLRYVAFLNADYSLNQRIPIPVMPPVANPGGSGPPNCVAALSETRFVWHRQVAGVVGETLIIDNGVETFPFSSTVNTTPTGQNSTNISRAIMLDSNHYFLIFDTTRFVIVQTNGNDNIELYKNTSFTLGPQNKDNFVYFDNDLFTIYKRTSTAGSGQNRFILFSTEIVYQPDV